MDSNQRYLSPYCLARSQSRPYAPNWDIETLTPEARANASQNVSRIRRGTDSIAWSPAVIRMAPAGSGLDFLKTRAHLARQAFARFG